MAHNYGNVSGYGDTNSHPNIHFDHQLLDVELQTNGNLQNLFSGANNSGFGPEDSNILFNQMASNNTSGQFTNHIATQGQQNSTVGGTTSQTSTTTTSANARPFKKRKPRKKKTVVPVQASANSTSNDGLEPTSNTTASDSRPSSNRPRGEATTFRNEENPNLSVSGNRPSLPGNLMSSLQNETLLGLRIAQNAVGQNKRITNQIKDELKEITLDYQRKIHLLALEHKIRSELLFKWVGVWNKVRGPNRFNNFCRYAAEARKLFDSSKSCLNCHQDNSQSSETVSIFFLMLFRVPELLPPAERMQQVAERWRQLDEDEQLKYNDWDFINSLRKKIGLKPVDDPEEITSSFSL
jgi:transposase-like protein